MRRRDQRETADAADIKGAWSCFVDEDEEKEKEVRQATDELREG